MSFSIVWQANLSSLTKQASLYYVLCCFNDIDCLQHILDKGILNSIVSLQALDNFYAHNA